MTRILIVLVIVFALAVPALAQDAMTPTVPPVDSDDIILSGFELVGVILASMLGGGATVGGLAIVGIRYVATSPVFMKYIEKAFDSQPPETREVYPRIC